MHLSQRAALNHLHVTEDVHALVCRLVRMYAIQDAQDGGVIQPGSAVHANAPLGEDLGEKAVRIHMRRPYLDGFFGVVADLQTPRGQLLRIGRLFIERPPDVD